MSKRFLIILAVLFGLFAGIVFLSKHKDNQSNSANGGSGQPSSHVQGEGNKGVTVVEYGDFQCPACGSYFPIVEEVRSKYGDDITFQFVHYPLVNIHQNAMAAHRAAEAAGRQGKFWEMYTILYQRQNSWSSASNPSRIFEDYATELGLNIDQYRNDYASEDVANTINADVKSAQAAGATGTPTFVINGKKVEELPQTYDGFIELIDAAIAQQAAQQGQGQ